MKNISGKTRILGIFGDPVAHSLSPLMQNAALQQAGIDAVYVPFHVRPQQLSGAVAAIRSLGLWGVNVTIPHKEAVLPLLDQVDKQAQLIGAVNTIVNRDGVLHGYNTDAGGFLDSLHSDLDFDPGGRRVLLLGAGGACRAALVALAETGASWLGVANRNLERAQRLVADFSLHFPGTTFAALPLAEGQELQKIVAAADLLVNTTSLGLHGEDIPLPWAIIPPKARIYDMVYRQSGTPLYRRAQNMGLLVTDGLGMLAAQGERAFHLWTGQKVVPGLMKDRLLTALRDN